jgi:hypothetical protein
VGGLPPGARWAAPVTGALTQAARGLRGLRWYLREVTGESKWDAYRERCEREGRTPTSRREFERHRAEHREQGAQGRCC